MRRPPPLPQPASKSTRALAAPSVDDVERDVVAQQAGPPGAVSQDPVGDPAPVIPLSVGSSAQRPRPSGLPEAHAGVVPEGDTDAALDAPSEPVRLREVWAAARARRKTLRAEVRRFTGRRRRRRALWIGGIAAVLVLALATLGAAYSPLFGVEKISIVGADQLDVATVEAALSSQLGTPLPLVNESEVKAALVAFPLVESYSLEARPPHELIVRIVERTPIGVIQTRAGYTLVDAAGVALSTTQKPAAGTPVLTVEGGTASPAFEAVGQVMRTLPASVLVQVTAVSATTPDDVTLTLGGSNVQVVWGSAEDSALKAVVLEKAMAARPPADVLVYDVSSPDSVVVR